MSQSTPDVALKAVIYADGGARPNPGIGGYGYHGYVYLPTPQKSGSGCKTALMTEKGYVKEKGGNGLDITPILYLDGFGPIKPEVTNNYAELVAANKALNAVKNHQPAEILLLLDSQYVLQGLSGWADKWQGNNWLRPDGNVVPNKDQWINLLATRKLLEDSGIKLTLQWVKGHDNGESLGNDLADKNASRGVILGKNLNAKFLSAEHDKEHETQTPAKGYWSSKIERNRLISHPRWYFTSADSGHLSHDGRHVYYFGDAGDDDDLIGRRSATATYSVLYLKEPDKHLHEIRDACKGLGAGYFQGPMRGYLDKIFNQDVLDELDQYGHVTLQRDEKRQRLTTHNNALLVEEIRPAKLAFRGMDRLNFLQSMLDGYLKREIGNESLLRATDITSQLYETTVSKSKTNVKLKSTITNVTRSMKFDVVYCCKSNEVKNTTIPLTVGIDLPDRNTLAALASEQLKVVVLSWPESDCAVRYATVVDTGDDIGIWSGIYSNLHLIAS